MDEKRHEQIAYEYLCHLEETKKWIEMCIKETLPDSTELEEGLRNGVYLAKLGHRFHPESVPLKRIYDINQSRYRQSGLTFRHTDNINHWLRAMTALGLPPIFLPETTDLYDRKNMPRVVYCIHALSLYLYRLGRAPPMPNLFGQAQFSDDAVQAMARELQRYGFPLPQFGKIGGILAGQLPVDEAEHHAAVIAINRATEEGDCNLMVQAMEHPAAQLHDIDHSLADLYLQSLMDALEEKKAQARERSLHSDYSADVYDELLTGKEIQAQLDCVNLYSALEQVAMAASKGRGDPQRLLKALSHPKLAIHRVRSNCGPAYVTALRSSIDQRGMERCDLQKIIDEVNREEESVRERQGLVEALNRSLESSDATRTFQLLRQVIKESGSSDLEVLDIAAALYHEEMSHFRSATGEDLSPEMICAAVRTLTQVARVTQAVDRRNVTELLFVLEEPLLSFDGVNTSRTESYMAGLSELRRSKIRRGEFCSVLTHTEIQGCITQVNEDSEQEGAMDHIQRAIDGHDAKQLAALLSSTGLTDGDPVEERAPLYLRLMRTLTEAKRRSLEDEEAQLSMDDVVEVMSRSRELASEAEDVCQIVAALNNLRDPDAFVQAVAAPCLHLPDLNRTQFQACTKRLDAQLKGLRVDELPASKAWVSHRLEQGIPVYLNVKTHEIRWKRPPDMDFEKLVSVRAFQELVASVVEDEGVEPVIIRLQAYIRGYLVRERLAQRLHHFHSNVDSVIKIQAWWRKVIQRQRYLQWQETQREEEQMRRLEQKPERRDMNFFRRHLRSIVLIQACVRRWLALRAFAAIKRGDMPLPTLRRFLHLLDIGKRDYDEEMQVQLLKSDVMQTIRRNKQLEKDIAAMDVKIGLLVKNQIALQEVVAHGHKLRKNFLLKLRCQTVNSQFSLAISKVNTWRGRRSSRNRGTGITITSSPGRGSTSSRSPRTAGGSWRTTSTSSTSCKRSRSTWPSSSSCSRTSCPRRASSRSTTTGPTSGRSTSSSSSSGPLWKKR